MANTRDILRKLDFNAVHSGDPVARAYFHEAAAAIRVLDADARHWERMALIERSNARSAHLDAKELARKLHAAEEREAVQDDDPSPILEQETGE